MWILGWGAIALAQSAQPTALEVLALAESTNCLDVSPRHVPRVLCTNIGVATSRGDGSYAWGCPSRYGGDPEAAVVVAPDGRTQLVVSEAGAYLSTNSGCTAELLQAAAGEAVDAVYWRQAFWWIERDLGVGVSTLYRTDGETVVAARTWTDFHPDGMTPEGNEHLWLAGAGPTVQVRRLTFTGGLANDEAMEGLPEDSRDISLLVPVAARDGEAWLRVERRSSEWTWHAEVLNAGEARFTDTGERLTVLHGPVWLDGRWVATFDLGVHTADPFDASWTDTSQQALWTCLHSLGERVFACTVDAMLAVESVGSDGVPLTSEVFRMAQVAGPDEACNLTAECTSEWQELGGEAALALEPAVCPDGTTAGDLEEGCGCHMSPGSRAVGALLLVGLARRRRHGVQPEPG